MIKINIIKVDKRLTLVLRKVCQFNLHRRIDSILPTVYRIRTLAIRVLFFFFLSPVANNFSKDGIFFVNRFEIGTVRTRNDDHPNDPNRELINAVRPMLRIAIYHYNNNHSFLRNSHATDTIKRDCIR